MPKRNVIEPGPWETILDDFGTQSYQRRELEEKPPHKILDDVSGYNVGIEKLITNYQVTPQNFSNFDKIVETPVLRLNGDASLGQMVTICVSSKRAAGYPGANDDNSVRPIMPVGVLKFGNGSASHRLEFDIPNGSFQNRTMWNGYPNIFSQQGGAIVSLPAGNNIELLVRDESKLSCEVGTEISCPAGGVGFNEGGCIIAASASYGSKGFSGRLCRSYLISYAGSLLAGSTCDYKPIPAFAKSMRAFRTPRNMQMVINFFASWYSTSDPVDTVVVAANTDCPVIDINPRVDRYLITNSGGSPLTYGIAVFDLNF